jgi:type IV pilus assembly protein PilO
MAKGNAALGRIPLAAKIGVGVGVPVLIAVAYFVVFYGDLSSSIQSARRQEDQLKSDLAALRQSEFAYQKDLAELKDKEQKQRELNKVLPETSDLPAFLSAIQTVANVSGVTLQSWTPMEEVRQQFYARVPMKLQLRGRFHQVAKFFWGVGQLDRIINVENITLGLANGGQKDDTTLRVGCLTTAFHTLSTKPAGK